MTNREAGLNILQAWYNQNPIALKYSFQDVINYYDNQSPNAITTIGQAVITADLPQDDILGALQKLHVDSDSQLPVYTDFGMAIAGQLDSVHLGDITTAVTSGVLQTAKVAGTVAVAGASLYALYAIGGLALVYFMSRRQAGA